MLDGNFCSSVVGVLKDSDADPCAGVPVDLPIPNFEGCPVYNVLTCAHLENMPNNGHWTMEDVNNSDPSSCIIVLYDYVFAAGESPQDNPFTPPGSGTLTFANKHGGGSAAVLNNCRTDITAKFESIVDTPGAPDHTKGALNAVLPYLVGVIHESNVDPCYVGDPPSACESFEDDSSLSYFTMDQVRSTSSASSCVVVVLGKVYNVQNFKQYHHGGADEIEEHCRQDITNDFFEKPFHTLVQLGAIQEFQIGVLQDSMADPCSARYVPNPDGPVSGGGGSGGEEEDESSSDSEDDKNSSLFVFMFEDKEKDIMRDCEWLGEQDEETQEEYCDEDKIEKYCSEVCD
jgi:cytochrome b involved in lipid metabolism